jgi:hypothetical protein
MRSASPAHPIFLNLIALNLLGEAQAYNYQERLSVFFL